MAFNELYKCRRFKALYGSMERKIMTAPGITYEKFANPDMITKSDEYGFLDCYENWEDEFPMREEKRIKLD